MTYYQVSRCGHLVAIVKTRDLAQVFMRSRRYGYYTINEIESDEAAPASAKRHTTKFAARRAVKHAPHHRTPIANKKKGASPSPKSRKPR